MKFTIDQFNGPLDLLLEMIEEQRLDITEISLANIAEQYIEYIENKIDIDPEEMADFLVIAARLLLIKSKTLLPYLVRDEEEEEIEDFTSQLKIYKDFLDASKKIEEILDKGNIMYARDAVKLNTKESSLFYPPPNLNLQNLQTVFAEIIKRLQPPEVLDEDVIVKSISLEEKIDIIRQALEKLKEISFYSILAKRGNKLDVIVSFVAILEMIKQKSITVKQVNLFTDITISKAVIPLRRDSSQ